MCALLSAYRCVQQDYGNHPILTCPCVFVFSKSLKDGYQENISGKYIQTVYSTSDR